MLSFQSLIVTKESIILSPYFLAQIQIVVCIRIRRIFAWNDIDLYENTKHTQYRTTRTPSEAEANRNTPMEQIFLNNAPDLKKKHGVVFSNHTAQNKTIKLFLTLGALLPIRRAVVCTHPGVWQENKKILQNTPTINLISAWSSKVTYFWINSTSCGRTNSHPMATFIRDICKTN